MRQTDLLLLLLLAAGKHRGLLQASCGGSAAASRRPPGGGLRRAVAAGMHPGVGIRVWHVALQQRVQYSHDAGADLGGVSLEVLVPVVAKAARRVVDWSPAP